MVKVGKGETPSEYKYSCTKDWGVNFSKDVKAGSALCTGPVPSTTSKEVLETEQEQHLSQEGPRPPASAWALPKNKVPVGSTCGCCWSTATSISGIKWGFPRGPQRFGKAQWLWGPSKSNNGSTWYPFPWTFRKAAWVFQMSWRRQSKWTEGLYPSTKNKVHHEWRLYKATCPRPRSAEKLPSPPTGRVGHFLQPGGWLLKSYCFFSLVLWNFTASKNWNFKEKQKNTWWAWQKACHANHRSWLMFDKYMLQSKSCWMMAVSSPFVLMNLGKLKFFLCFFLNQIGSWCF